MSDGMFVNFGLRIQLSSRWFMMLAIAFGSMGQPRIAQAQAVNSEILSEVTSVNFADRRLANPGAIAALDLLQTPPLETATSGGICPHELPGRMQAIANRPGVAYARWGIAVETMATANQAPISLYAQADQQWFVPASNVKVLVTAAALHQFGADFQIRTSVYQEPDTSQLVLRVVGRGDPSLTTADLRSLAQQLQQQGITHIDRLIADDSYFQGESISPFWDPDDLEAGYAAPTNSLILNRNAIGVDLYPQRVGQPLRMEWEFPEEAIGWQVFNNTRTVDRSQSEYIFVGRDMDRPILYLDGQLWEGAPPDLSAVAVTDPVNYFLQRFEDVLAERQITVGQMAIATDPSPQTGVELAAINSDPISELILEANQHSTNLYAEALLRQLGTQQASYPHSSRQSGLQAIATILSSLNVDPRGFQLDDGSGLSRQNQISPATLVGTLQAMARSPYADLYRNSLALAGVNGTLRSRFQNTVMSGRLWGKTGTLSDAVSLSGYLMPNQHPPIVFSILVNHPNLSLSETRAAIDDMVLALGQLRSCGEH